MLPFDVQLDPSCIAQPFIVDLVSLIQKQIPVFLVIESHPEIEVVPSPIVCQGYMPRFFGAEVVILECEVISELVVQTHGESQYIFG